MKTFLRLVIFLASSSFHIDLGPVRPEILDQFVCGRDTLMCSGSTPVCVACDPIVGCGCGKLNRKPCYGTVCECGLTYKADTETCVR